MLELREIPDNCRRPVNFPNVFKERSCRNWLKKLGLACPDLGSFLPLPPTSSSGGKSSSPASSSSSMLKPSLIMRWMRPANLGKKRSQLSARDPFFCARFNKFSQIFHNFVEISGKEKTKKIKTRKNHSVKFADLRQLSGISCNPGKFCDNLGEK